MEKGTKIIVRCDRSGVFYGEFSSRQGHEIELTNVRRLWSWSGATECLQLAAEGVIDPDACQFTMYVPKILVLDAIEIHECSAAAQTSIEGVEIWKI